MKVKCQDATGKLCDEGFNREFITQAIQAFRANDKVERYSTSVAYVLSFNPGWVARNEAHPDSRTGQPNGLLMNNGDITPLGLRYALI